MVHVNFQSPLGPTKRDTKGKGVSPGRCLRGDASVLGAGRHSAKNDRYSPYRPRHGCVKFFAFPFSPFNHPIAYLALPACKVDTFFIIVLSAFHFASSDLLSIPHTFSWTIDPIRPLSTKSLPFASVRRGRRSSIDHPLILFIKSL